MHVVLALLCFCSTVLHCQHIPCADPFSGCNVHVADFSDDEYGALGHGLSLSDAVGVDGLTLSSKPSAVIVLDSLKPYLL